MCGIPRLLRELQKRQMNHMLSQRQQLLSNLQRLSKKLNVQVCACLAYLLVNFQLVHRCAADVVLMGHTEQIS